MVKAKTEQERNDDNHDSSIYAYVFHLMANCGCGYYATRTELMKKGFDEAEAETIIQNVYGFIERRTKRKQGIKEIILGGLVLVCGIILSLLFYTWSKGMIIIAFIGVIAVGLSLLIAGLCHVIDC